jgi:hypothetical protein
MNIIHDYYWKFRIVRQLLGQSSIEKQPNRKSNRPRDTMPSENQHLLRDVGLTDHVAAQPVGRKH